MNKFTKQCVAAMASLAMAGTLCVAGAVVAGSSAWAVDGTACDASKAPWANTVNCVGSITIKKYEDKGNGDTSVPLPGAKFKVQRVTKLSTSDTTNTDLKDYKNWEALATKVKSLNDNPNQAGMEFDASATQEDATGSEGANKGVVKFSNLPIGLYRVEETEPAPGHSNDVTPFYMTIPEITHESGKAVTYSYDVTAQPKNQSLAGKITKTLVRGENETAFVGKDDTMTYKISAAVTSNTDTKRDSWTKDDLTGYTVFDQAPAGVFTDYTDTVVKSAQVVYKENGTTDKSVPLKDKSTNNITVTTEDVKGKDNSTTVATRIKVSFNDAGLTSIATAAKADANAKVEVEFAFTIKDPTQVTEKSFTNKSGFIPGKGKNKPTPTPEVPGDGGSTVTSNYGYLQVNKYDGTFAKDSQDAKAKLANAKFKLFAKKADADACAADTTAQACANASKVGELTTVAGGKFQTPVKVVVDDSTHPFYIVETEAPANYERDHQAHVVNVSATSTETNPTPVDIANVPTKDNGSWFHLPKTGAAGVVIFALAGVCLVCFGIFVFMRNRKKDEEQQAA